MIFVYGHYYTIASKCSTFVPPLFLTTYSHYRIIIGSLVNNKSRDKQNELLIKTFVGYCEYNVRLVVNTSIINHLMFKA